MKKVFFRWLTSFAFLGLLFICWEPTSLQEIEEGKTAILYANPCEDDLQKLFIRAIEKAQTSIVLIIYTLSDGSIIDTLNKRADEGISITVLHDPSTLKRGLSRNINTIPIKITGLMHQKILVVDEQKIWMGSANLTPHSLKLDDNLVIALYNTELAKTILDKKGHADFFIGEQRIEFWSFPPGGDEAMKRLITLIDQATESVEVAMFTWTHPLLTETIIRAHKRGVLVKVLLDQATAYGASSKASQQLIEAGIPTAFSSGFQRLHHKFVWIDKSILINGSANWTRAAFSRNWDYFLILHNLTDTQCKKMKQLWKILKARSRLARISHKQPVYAFL